MRKAITASTIKRKKPGPPKTTGPGEQVVVRLHEPLLSNIDKWRDTQDDAPTRAEALRRLSEIGLTAPPANIPRLIATGDAAAEKKQPRAKKAR